MPDVFGQATPQEVLQQQRENVQSSRAAFAKTAGGQGSGGQAGLALGAIFGGVIRKGLDTRRDRKDEVVRLMKEGMTEDEAKAQAKDTIGFGTSAGRRAKRVEEATRSATEVMAKVSAVAGPQRAQAVGNLMVSQELRKIGMHAEATALSQEAAVLIQADDERLLGVRKAKAETRGAEIDVELKGATSFRQNQLQREMLLGKLANPDNTPAENERINVQIGELDAKIDKDSTIVGRSAHDVANDPTAMRQLFTDFTTDLVLLEGLDLADSSLDDLSTYEATILGAGEARFRAFLEKTFGIEPSESSAAFIDRIVASKGIATLVAAKIRHSLTGAQMSQFEIEFLKPFLPSPGDSRTMMKAKIAAVRAYTQQSADIRLQLIESKTLGQFMKGHQKGFRQREAADAPTRDDTIEEARATIKQAIADRIAAGKE